MFAEVLNPSKVFGFERASACSPALAEAFSSTPGPVSYAIWLPLYYDATVQDNQNTLFFTFYDRISSLLQQCGCLFVNGWRWGRCSLALGSKRRTG